MSRFSYKSLILILLFLLIPIVLFLRISQRTSPAAAGWFNDSWTYRQRVDIANSSGSDLTDFQVSIDIGTSALIAAGKMQSDCDDIRITDQNGNLLPYWIEENNPGCNQVTDTKIWVKAPSIPSSGAPVYLYYGNSSATSSQNGNDVFEFFDDFSTDTTSDYSWYNIDNNAPTNSHNWDSDNHWLEIRSGNDDFENPSKNVNIPTSGHVKIIMTKRLDYPAANVQYFDIRQDASNYYRFDWEGSSYSSQGVKKVVSNSTVDSSLETGTVDADNTQYVIDGYWTPTNLRLDINGVNRKDIGTTNTTQLTPTSFYFNNNQIDHDWELIYINKYSLTPPTATPQTEEVGGGPIAHWKFDEGVGTTAYDSTGNNSHGTFGIGGSAPTWTSDDQCVSGKCLRFDNVDDVLTAPYINLTNTFTVSLWLKANTFNPTTDDGLFYECETSATGKCLHIVVRAGKPFLGFYGNDLQANTTLDTNKWYFLTYQYDGTKQNIYINGKIDNSRTTTAYNGLSGTVYLGRAWTNNTYTFDGHLDDIKVYPYARTESQIKADYAAGLAGMSSSSDSSVNIGGASIKSLSDGLVGYWKMDESSWNGTVGEATDSSGNNNNGYSFGSTLPTISSGKFGNGGYFPGDTCGFRVPNSSSINFGTSTDFSIVFWIKTSDTNSYLVRKFSSTGPGYRTQLVNGNINFTLTDGTNSATITSSSTINDGVWHQVIAIADRTENLKLYVDNVSVANPVSAISVTDIGNTATFQISAGYAGIDGNLEGFIDEVRLYNRALSPTEVKQLYDFAPGPVVHYKFEEKSGSVAADSSGNNYTSTFSAGTSAPSWTTGKYGSGLRFSGNNQSASGSITPNIVSKVITQSGWYKFDNLTGIQRFVSSNSQGYVQAGLSTNTIFIHSINSAGADYNVGNLTLPSNCQTGWHYLTIIRDSTLASNNVKAYCDGVQFTSGNFVNGLNGTYTINLLEIGKTSSDQSFNGFLDDFKIYNYARTQKQILEDMSGSPPPGSSAKVSTPLVHYKFDEGFGSTANNSGSIGSTANGTLAAGTSAPTWTNNGKSGKALSFDGSTRQYASAPAITSLTTGSPFTISVWVNPENTNSYRTILGYNSTHRLLIASSGIMLSQQDTSFYSGSSGDVPNSTWTHVVYWFNGSEERWYINGKLSGTPHATTLAEWDSTYKIGQYDNANYPYKGLIDEVKIYNYALTPDEVRQDYNSGASFVFGSSNQTIGATTTSLDYCIPGDTSPCSPPVAEWKFEEGVGTTAYDTSGNNNHGIFGTGSSAPSWTTGKIGKGLIFNGTNQYVDISNPSNLDFGTGNFTVDWWMKYPISQSASYAGIIVDKSWNSSASNTNWWGIVQGSSNNILKYYEESTGDGSFDTNITLTSDSVSNGWHHFTFIRDTTNDKIYLIRDGNQIYNNSYTSDVSLTSHGIYINRAGNIFSGNTLDNVRIYNYARTPAQIAYDYNQGAPVGHWKLDECQGTVIHDSSGNNNHGTLSIGASGTQTSPGTCEAAFDAAWSNGKLGKLNASLNFDGSDDSIDIGTSFQMGTSDFSVGLWTKANSPTANSGIFSRGLWGANRPTKGYGIITAVSGNGKFEFEVANTTTASNTSISSVWQHIVGVRSGTNLLIYVNGKLENQTSSGSVANLDMSFTNQVAQRGVNVGFYSGQIDDVRIYNYALTPTQVKTLYNNGSVNFR